MGLFESLLLGWIAGTAWQLQQSELWTALSYAGLAAAAALGLAALMVFTRQRRRTGWHNASAVVAAAALAFSWVGLRAVEQSSHNLNPALEGQTLQVRGVVVGLPQFNDQGVRFRLHVEHADSDGQAVVVPEWMDLGWWGGVQRRDANPDETEALPEVPRITAGDRWQMAVRLKAPHGHANPHGFDVELWMWEQGVGASGTVRAGRRDEPPQWLGDGGGERMARWRQQLRDKLLTPQADAAQTRARSVVAALVVGDQSAIERADWDIYRATGVAHLMSISGLHITLFAWLAIKLGRALWSRSSRLCLWVPAPVAARVLGLMLATLYAVFSGWGVPAQRTIWMLVAVHLLGLSGRRWPGRTVWLSALALVVCVDPWAMLQAGFWLSFVAVGVLMATDRGTRESAPQSWRWRIWHNLRDGLREQWLISLALAPLTLLLFQQMSLAGLLANLLAIPWVTLVVTPLSFLGALVPVLWDGATQAVLWLNALLAHMAAWPWATFSLPAAPLPLSLAAALGGVLLVLRWPGYLRGMGVVLVLPMLLYEVPRPAAGQFDVLAMDVGQGNAVLVRTQHHSLLFDAGPRYSPDSDAGHRVVVPLLRAIGERLDLMMLSHKDIDHTGGAPAILAMQPQVRVLSSMPAPAAGLAWQRCVSGQSWEWDGIRFQVLHPRPEDYDLTLKSNAMSCVLKVSSASSASSTRSLLLTGDIEQAQEALLLSTWPADLLRSDVLLVPHHGSKTSSSQAFLDTVHPDVALVQAGYRNRFGHPAPVVMDRYAHLSVHVVRSDQCGAWWWASDAPMNAPKWCQRWGERRYWQHQTLIWLQGTTGQNVAE